MNISHYNELINSAIDDDIELFFSGENHPSERDVEDFGSEIGCLFPEDFKCLAASYLDGFYAEAKEEVWPRKQGGAYWMFQYALLVYGLDSNLPEWASLKVYVLKFREQTDTILTPFMRTISSSEPYCFTPQGEIVKWSSDAWEAEPINKSFFEVFKLELDELYNLKCRAVSENI